MSKGTKRSEARKPVLIRRSHPVRDNIEGILGALLLALIVRYFVFEMFVIPTGSMAPTLLGRHRDLTCPNCGHEFALDSGPGTDGRPQLHRAFCRNCGYEIPERTVRNTFCRCFPSWPRAVFWRGGNRVIVNKFMAHYRKPRRWDVTVFRYPRVEMKCKSCGYSEEVSQADADEHYVCPYCGSDRIRKIRKNYIKRLIGLPGETVELRHGDVYIDGVIARKPPEIQEQLWQFLYDSAYRIERPQRDKPTLNYYTAYGVKKEPDYNVLAPNWEAIDGTVKRDEAAFTLTPDPDGKAMLGYVNPILDFNPYNGGGKVVFEGMGDLRVTVKAKLPEGGALAIHIREDDNLYTGIVRFGETGLATSVRSGAQRLADSDVRLDPAVEHVLVFSNADDLLELRANGETLLRCPLDIPLSDVPKAATNGGVAISAYGGRAELNRIRLERDIFYVSESPRFEYAPEAVLPEDAFYMLGDNAAATSSKDSRYWGFVPAENILGVADVVCWPLAHLRTLRDEGLAASE